MNPATTREDGSRPLSSHSWSAESGPQLLPHSLPLPHDGFQLVSPLCRLFQGESPPSMFPRIAVEEPALVHQALIDGVALVIHQPMGRYECVCVVHGLPPNRGLADGSPRIRPSIHFPPCHPIVRLVQLDQPLGGALSGCGPPSLLGFPTGRLLDADEVATRLGSHWSPRSD